ncbi:hypothetical protein BURKHO8Y_40037 [Burkholderia sp. 8Y]|nr:hypothetical protein BURKHO8Y_40037 [Burkholderia sp. 8Y]
MARDILLAVSIGNGSNMARVSGRRERAVLRVLRVALRGMAEIMKSGQRSGHRASASPSWQV